MIHILATAPTGKEFATAEAINDLGGDAIVPRRVVITTDKGKTTYDYRPFLPNYLFLAIDELKWSLMLHRSRAFVLRDCNGAILQPPRHLDDILPRTWASFQDFAERAEQECIRRVEQFESGLRVARYMRGDKLRILGDMMDGQLQGRMATFVRMQGGNAIAQVDDITMLGRPIMVTLEPGQIAAE